MALFETLAEILSQLQAQGARTALLVVSQFLLGPNRVLLETWTSQSPFRQTLRPNN
jgi:hypothetical protein